ncbi:MAG: hypothetical protein JW874_06665, partial [Spirochaetales bacterium]|nr:hypothetical protein [Spirochaetales bacterium]
SGDVQFLVCGKNRQQTADFGEGLLRFWRNHPLIIIFALSAITGGPLFIPLLILRFNKGHKRWLNRRLCGGEEVSVIADSRALQVPGQIAPIPRRRIVAADVYRHRNANAGINLEVDLVSSGGGRDTFYIQGLSEEEATQVSGFLNRLVVTR